MDIAIIAQPVPTVQDLDTLRAAMRTACAAADTAYAAYAPLSRAQAAAARQVRLHPDNATWDAYSVVAAAARKPFDAWMEAVDVKLAACAAYRDASDRRFLAYLGEGA